MLSHTSANNLVLGCLLALVQAELSVSRLNATSTATQFTFPTTSAATFSKSSTDDDNDASDSSSSGSSHIVMILIVTVLLLLILASVAKRFIKTRMAWQKTIPAQPNMQPNIFYTHGPVPPNVGQPLANDLDSEAKKKAVENLWGSTSSYPSAVHFLQGSNGSNWSLPQFYQMSQPQQAHQAFKRKWWSKWL